MRDEPIGLPFQIAGRRIALAGLRMVWGLAMVMLTAVRLLLIVVLRLVQPFLVLPLLLAMVGGVGAAAVFGLGNHWLDAAKAGTVAIGCAVLLMAYSLAAVWLDPEHFAPRPVPSWRRYL